MHYGVTGISADARSLFGKAIVLRDTIKETHDKDIQFECETGSTWSKLEKLNTVTRQV